MNPGHAPITVTFTIPLGNIDNLEDRAHEAAKAIFGKNLYEITHIHAVNGQANVTAALAR